LVTNDGMIKLMIFSEKERSASHLTYIIFPSSTGLLSVSIAGPSGHRRHPYSLDDSAPVTYRFPIGCCGPVDEGNHRRKAEHGRPIALASTFGCLMEEIGRCMHVHAQSPRNIRMNSLVGSLDRAGAIWSCIQLGIASQWRLRIRPCRHMILFWPVRL
jgi:hypothetical protein